MDSHIATRFSENHGGGNRRGRGVVGGGHRRRRAEDVAADDVVQGAGHRARPRRLRRGRRHGHESPRQLPALEGVTVAAVCDIDQSHARAGAQEDRRCRAAGAEALHARRARLRADVRRAGARSRVHRDAVGMARAGDAGGAEDRQARGDRGAGRVSRRRLLGAGRSGGEVQQARGDDGELLLRPARDVDADAGPQRALRRAAARRVRLSPRSAVDQVLEGGRRACGGGPTRSRGTATSTRRTVSGRSRSASTSIAATSSTTWSR